MRTRRGWLVLCMALAAPGLLTAEAQAPDPAEALLDRSRTKVVVFKVTREDGRSTRGTGFFAAPGLLVTAQHVVAQAESVTVFVNTGRYAARVVAEVPHLDLAVLSIRPTQLRLKPLALAENSRMGAGEPLLIVATDAALPDANADPDQRVPISARYQQRVLVKRPMGGMLGVLRLEASIRRGDSGSPVLRGDGSVVGVISSREVPDANDRSEVAFAVPVEALTPLLRAAERATPAPGEDFYLLPAVR